MDDFKSKLQERQVRFVEKTTEHPKDLKVLNISKQRCLGQRWRNQISLLWVQLHLWQKMWERDYAPHFVSSVHGRCETSKVEWGFWRTEIKLEASLIPEKNTKEIQLRSLKDLEAKKHLNNSATISLMKQLSFFSLAATNTAPSLDHWGDPAPWLRSHLQCEDPRAI